MKKPLSRGGSGVRVLALRLGLFGAILALWLYQSGPGGTSPLLLPTPGNVFIEVWGHVTSLDFWANAGVTAGTLLISFVLTCAIGLSIGYLLANGTKWRQDTFEPIVVTLYTVPVILFYPIILLAVGYGIESKVMFAVVYGVFPVILNTARGLRTVPEPFLRTGASLGVSRVDMLLKIRIRAALPLIVTGLRVGAAYNVLGIITGEMIASAAGLGHMISVDFSLLQITSVYSLVLLTVVAVWAVNSLVSKAEESLAGAAFRPDAR